MAQHLRSPLSLSSQFAHCALPLRLDSYKGCSFSCSYCFARRRGGNVGNARVVPANRKTLGRIFAHAGDDDSGSIVHQMLRRRVPIHFGGMSDPFQPRERRERVSFEFLSELAQRGYPTIISTKGVLAADRDYLGLLGSGWPAIVQFSLTSTEDARAARVEPHATQPSILLKAMTTLARAGVIVTCRWQPFIEELVEDPALYVQRVADAGASHISLEHLKLPLESTPRSRANASIYIAGLRALYKRRGVMRDGREYVLAPAAKFKNTLEIRKLTHKHGMSFGAGDNELQFLSDGEACCSGADRFPGFENVFKYQIGLAVKRGETTGTIAMSNVAGEWSPHGSVDRYLNSKTRLSGRSQFVGTVADHIGFRWETLSSFDNPSKFFGVRLLPAREPTGSRVFVFDKAMSERQELR
jgi:DNA repair photolyase